MAHEERPDEGARKGKGRGEMIVVASAKGGVGRTVLSVNLALALAKSNRAQVGVIDGSFQFGDVCLAMDLTPTFTIKDVVEGFDVLDAFALSSYLMRHPYGVRVLAAPDRPEFADLVTPPVLEKVCDYMLELHDYVIVDTGAGLQERSLQLIEKADQVFVVTNLEMATIKNTKLMLETLELLGLKDKTQIIVNRSTMESVIQAGEVSQILGEDTPFTIPNQFQISSQSLNVGIPFVINQAKSDVAKAVFKMAEQLISRREIAVFQPKAPSLLQSFFHKPRMT